LALYLVCALVVKSFNNFYNFTMFDYEGNVDQKGGNVDQKGSPLDVIALLLEIKLCHGVTRELLMLIFYHISIVVYF
jgi:hypothetical protein